MNLTRPQWDRATLGGWRIPSALRRFLSGLPFRFCFFERVGHSSLSLSNPRPFNTLPPRSNDAHKVIDKQYTSLLSFCMFVYTELPSACTPPRPSVPTLSGSGNQNPRRPSRSFHFPLSLFDFPVLPKLFRINTYENSRKCCKQRTYRIAKSFRCNTYEKTGG